MHTKTLKNLALALTFWLALHSSSLRAQILVPSTSPVFGVNTSGLLWDTGTSGTIGISGAGTRMFWSPGLAAFRAGSVSGNQWDSYYIGQYSVAFGFNTTASGYASTATGLASSASGNFSTAMGGGTAIGDYSMALGMWTMAVGPYSTALGTADAIGCNATAMGNGYAGGSGSTAFGQGASASGNYSTASGLYTSASGYSSTASGAYTTASAYDSLAVGTFNLNLSSTGAAPNATAWVGTDPLFEVGNGTGVGAFGNTSGNPYASGPSDALVVYKNGSAAFQGPVTVAPASDIPMYQPGD